jgi:hypothetical protein
MGMKAERRHELKHNELSDWLGERLELLKPHATGIILGLVLLGVILIGATMYLGGKNRESASAWTRYFQAFSDREPQKSLELISTNQSGSKAAWWAVLTVGDMELGQGSALLYSDRVQAQEHLKQARSSYERAEASDDPMVRSRARLGLAKVHESLANVEEALKYYELVAKDTTNAAIAKAAAADVERLKDKDTAEFLAWFAKQTPKRPAPMPGLGGNVPGLPPNLSDRPDMSMPQGLLESLNTTAPTDPSTTPALPPPADAPPADPQPPADTEKKADNATAEPNALPPAESTKSDTPSPDPQKKSD